MNKEEILNRLKNGESVDSIADAFTKALNEANAALEAEEKAKAIAEEKIEDTEILIDTVIDYLDTYYPELASYIDSEYGDKEIEEFIEELDATISMVTNLVKFTKKFETPKGKATVITNAPDDKADDIINSFLKAFNL